MQTIFMLEIFALQSYKVELSDNRLSKIWTTSIQWTSNVPLIDFAIEIINF